MRKRTEGEGGVRWRKEERGRGKKKGRKKDDIYNRYLSYK